MTLRERKMERTRDLIAETALALFRDKGFAATTVEEIAAVAEVGARTVYRHYPTKESLVLSSFAIMFETGLKDLRACPEDAELPDVLRVILESLLRSHLGMPERLMTAYKVARDTPSVLAHFVYMLQLWETDLAREVATRVAGRSADLVAELAVRQTGSVFVLAHRKWFESDGRADLRELTVEALDLVRSDAVPVPSRLS
ncbi:TetR family transcriptional regulator [Nonomuraea sp. PA05]|uniref:TetR/AcrR family transcriptional regulator n=1 Tax=Nonomuraea sp. PA05 TaxID=2604466 RepID=UPI0011D6C787|nr:TetR/AcrR family transcriptional regulator [Nonomuraea sp. PA05]TYB60136.1 TetR family transcriptional regulator [Nonomuraea sp. PA05]